MENFLSVTKALSDKHRVRALLALRYGELCVCQITEFLKLAPSTVSKHMSILKQAGLVISRKQERWVYYRLPKRKTFLVNKSLKLLFDTLTINRTVNRMEKNDRKRLKNILLKRKSDIC